MEEIATALLTIADWLAWIVFLMALRMLGSILKFWNKQG